MQALTEWDSFYVIVASSAGALIGLQFVVMTLVATRPTRPAAEAGATYATPTIVHFGTVLLLSALLRMPWQSIYSAAGMCDFLGITGILYSAFIANRMRRRMVYQPVLEDWLFHAWLPLAAYIVLALSGFFMPGSTHGALFGAGSAALMLLFIGIHNAWDGVAYHVFDYGKKDKEP